MTGNCLAGCEYYINWLQKLTESGAFLPGEIKMFCDTLYEGVCSCSVFDGKNNTYFIVDRVTRVYDGKKTITIKRADGTGDAITIIEPKNDMCIVYSDNE